MLRIDAGILIVLAVVLAWPVPAALARAGWTARSPRPALVLWQAVGLGGGLSILGAGLTLAAASLSRHWVAGLAALPDGWSRLGPLGWAGVALTAIVGVWLLAVAAASGARVVLARRAHRYRLDAVGELLPHFCDTCPMAAPEAVLASTAVGRVAGGARAPGEPSPGELSPGGPEGGELGPGGLEGESRPCPACVLDGVHLLPHPGAVAYCLPGLRPRIVVSSGALQALDAEELLAVVAHERAHARGHHDLVVQPFVAWRQTFPFLPVARRALEAVALLVEMLADDAARQGCPPEQLPAALTRLATAGAADHQQAAQIIARRSRLDRPPRPLPHPVQALLYAAAVALVLVPPLVLLLS